MADLVGEAYIRITADNSAMRDAVERDGARAGKGWANAFSKEVEKVRSRIASALSNPKEFNQLAAAYDNVSDAAEDFVRILQKESRHKRIARGELAKYRDTIYEWRDATLRANAAAAATLERNKSLNNMFVLQTQGLKNLTAARKRDAAAAARAQAAAERTAAALQKATPEIEKHNSRIVQWSRDARIGLDRVTIYTDRFGIAMGRAFGKGSRNNFLNWTGSMVGGLTRLSIGVFTFPVRAVTHIADTFGTAFSASRAAGLTKMASAGKALSAVFRGGGGLAGALAGVVAGGFLLGEVLPGVISLMSMLGGVVSSIVGSIGIGLTGAFLALIPAIGGAVAGLGALGSVFVSFFKNEDNKKFVKDFFKPFEDMNKSYYPKVKTFLTNIKGGFDDLIKDIKPSIDTFFDSFDAKINDPTTRRDLGKWSDALGRIATSLSNASTSFLSGLTGFFVPVLPYAERLGNIIERIAVDFDTWSGKSTNRNKIAEFMDKAWIAADKVFRIVGNIGGIIGDVFMGGEQTGTTLLDRMLTKLQEINTFLDTPEGKAKMDEWFGDVKQIGSDIGTLATNIGEMIAAFNSPEGRANATAIMDAVVTMSEAALGVAKLADSIGRIASYLNPILMIMKALNPDAGRGRKTDPSKPQSVPTLPSTAQLTKSGSQDLLTEYKIKLKPDVAEFKTQLAAIEAYQSTGVQIPIKGNEELWNATKNTIAMTIFAPKQIPVEGDTKLWDQTKGTVQAFVFDSKTVAIKANADPAIAAIEKVRKWLNNLPSSKTIRIAGVNSVGGLTMAAGGILTGPTWTHPNVLAGEAGREAYVPLDRPLNQIDPAVRALAAFAQGKTSMASGGVIGASRSITVAPGAIIVQSPHSNPALVAEAVLDRLVSFA
jgi:hypothetical protein